MHFFADHRRISDRELCINGPSQTSGCGIFQRATPHHPRSAHEQQILGQCALSNPSPPAICLRATSSGSVCALELQICPSSLPLCPLRPPTVPISPAGVLAHLLLCFLPRLRDQVPGGDPTRGLVQLINLRSGHLLCRIPRCLCCGASLCRRRYRCQIVLDANYIVLHYRYQIVLYYKYWMPKYQKQPPHICSFT